MATVKNIYEYIDKIAPFASQEEWDNSGILVGSQSEEIKKAVVCLDATKEAARFAAANGAQLIISHHPIIFDPVTSLQKGSAVYICAQNGISVISAHTNFDNSKKGINRELAKRLGLKNARRIKDSFLFVGELEREMTVRELAEFSAKALGSDSVRFADCEKTVKTVAVGGGVCDEYIEIAMKAADCFLTGELKYHIMLDCLESGYPVIAAGHYETEYLSFMPLAEELKKAFPEVEFLSADQKNPVSAV